MTDQHRATPEQWEYQERWASDDDDASCILELRCRVEALEADQLEQAESNRFCTDAIVRRVEALEAHDKEDASCWAMVRSGMHALRERVEALEATQHAHADVSRLSDAEREQVAQELAKPAAWRPLEVETTYGSDCTTTAQQIQTGTTDELQAALVGLRDRAPGSLKSTIYARFEPDPKHNASATASDEPISTTTAQQILRAPMMVEGTFEHGGETYRFKAKPEREAAMAELRAASAEAQGLAILSWSEERQPCEGCRYNHCIAETPFGRFLISWKGWKDHFAVTADETPFGDWFECWNSVEEAKSGCQSEYNRRLALVPLSHPQPELPTASAEARPAGLVEQVSKRIEYGIDAEQDPEGIARAAIREVAAWLRTFPEMRTTPQGVATTLEDEICG